MRLTWVTAKKEFTSNILSLRLLIGLIVCSVLFVSSTYVLTRDYEKTLRAYNAAEAEHRNELEKVNVYSKLKVNVDKAPEPLSAICLGMEKQLRNTVLVSYEDVPTGASLSGGNPPFGLFSYQFLGKGWLSGGGNPLLNVFSYVDAVVIVQIALSLFTILIAYDVVSGERERGTLGLVMSNPVSRFQVLIGKYLGGMGSILLSLVIGWIAGIMLMLASPMVEFPPAEWGRIGLLFIVSVLHLSIFFLLSMLVSAKATRSATALIWLLFLWVVLVLVIPNGFAYLAGQVRPIESKAKVDAERNSMMDELRQKVVNYGEKHQSWSYVKGSYEVYSGMYPIASQVLNGSREAMLWYLDGARFYVPLSIEYGERVGDIYERYYRSLRKQTILAENLSRLSPGWVYYNISAILTGTDLGRYEQFIKRAQDYRRELMEYMREQGAFSTIKWFTRAELEELPSQEGINGLDREARGAFLDRLRPKSWDEVGSLDLSGMPVFASERESLIAVIGRALPDLAILVLLNALLFWGAAAFFLE